MDDLIARPRALRSGSVLRIKVTSRPVAGIALALVSAGVGLGLVLGGPDSPRSIAADTWGSCAACHAAPDPSVTHDDKWIALNLTTQCLTGDSAAPEQRGCLIEYLRSNDVPRPTLMSSA